jgi:hypothetical protein
MTPAFPNQVAPVAAEVLQQRGAFHKLIGSSL